MSASPLSGAAMFFSDEEVFSWKPFRLTLTGSVFQLCCHGLEQLTCSVRPAGSDMDSRVPLSSLRSGLQGQLAGTSTSGKMNKLSGNGFKTFPGSQVDVQEKGLFSDHC